MKQVSLKVAKAIKEAGYPQYGSCEEYYDTNGKVVDKMCDMHKLVYPRPTYLQIWLWLWREKGVQIDIDYSTDTCSIFRYALCYKSFELSDPEETIEKVIEYLVENDLIK